MILVLLASCNQTYVPVEPEMVLAERNINIDGKFEDWKGADKIRIFSNEFGQIPDAKDLKAEMQAVWSGQGFTLCFTINDDVKYIHPDSCCKSDAVEIFISPDKGRDDIVQYSIPLAFDHRGNANIYVTDHRKKCYLRSVGPYQKAKGIKEGNTTKLEVFIATEAIGKKPEMGETFSMQVYVNDPDFKNDPDKNSLKLFPGNFSEETSYTHYPVKLGKTESKLYQTTSRAFITDDKNISLAISGFTGKGSLSIYKGKELVKEALIQNEYLEDIVTIDPGNEFDVMNDTLSVVLNGTCIGFHNLLVTPRNYVNKKAPAFYESINVFRLKDKIMFPEPGGALFIGSSSIRLWGSAQEDFPELIIIHRGFGGSTSKDVLHYMDEIAIPYKPGMIVYYEGDNDIVANMPQEDIISNMTTFITSMQAENKDLKIYLLSPKPSFARLSYWDEYRALHSKMMKMAEAMEGVFFVDVSTRMFNKDGSLREDIFCKDQLHLNDKGYIIWKQVLREKLGLAPN